MSHNSHNSHGSHGSHGNHHNHSSHGNHLNYGDMNVNKTYTNTGSPKTITWSNWGTLDDDEYIKDSVPKIEELREKIQWLHDHHGGGHWNQNPPDNPNIDLSDAAPEEFDGVGTDYVEDIQYDALRNSLETLKQHIAGTGTGLPNKSEGDLVNNEDFASLKAEIDSLANYNASSQYTNHNSHNDHDNHDNHESHGNHNNYYN